MLPLALTGAWLFQADPDDVGLKEAWFTFEHYANNWNRCKNIGVPHNWNAMPGLERYEGVAWYFKEVRRPAGEDFSSKECFLQFKGVNYQATVWWNGKKLGIHEGGFLPFEFPVPVKLIEGTNIVSVRVENIRKADRIPGLVFDWYNWGGIHRAVQLAFLPPRRITYAKIETTSVETDFALLKLTIRVTAAKILNWQVKDKEKMVAWGKETLRTVEDIIRMKIPDPKIWDIGKPNLYTLVLSLSDTPEETRIRFGVRMISVRGTQILLNNRPVKLRGVNLHEEQMPYGRSYPIAMRHKEVRDIRALGFNAIRSAHYPHDEILPQLCDELGLVLLEEIPVYWECDYGNPKVFRLAASMLKDLVYRDQNHPSVIMWSCGNEIPIERPSCARFMRQLINWVKKLDPSRIVSYVGSRFTADDTRRYGDVNAINEYFGWYYLTTNVLPFMMDVIYSTNPRTPWLVTEFGADAKLGFRDRDNDPVKFSEDKQAAMIAHTIRILNAKPYIAGWFIWLYRDFKSPLRTNQYQVGFNRKGLVSEKGEKKVIALAMPRIIRDVERKVGVHLIRATFFRALMKYIEKGIFLVIAGKISKIQERMTQRYYSGEILPLAPPQPREEE